MSQGIAKIPLNDFAKVQKNTQNAKRLPRFLCKNFQGTFPLGRHFFGLVGDFFVPFSVTLPLPSFNPRLYGAEGGGLDIADLGDSIVVVVQVVLKD